MCVYACVFTHLHTFVPKASPLSFSTSPSLPLPRPHSVQEHASLKTDLTSRSKALQEAQENSARLLSDLHRAKNAAKGSGGEGRGHTEKVTELEERLRQVEDDNLSLQVCVGGCGCGMHAHNIMCVVCGELWIAINKWMAK